MRLRDDWVQRADDADRHHAAGHAVVARAEPEEDDWVREADATTRPASAGGVKALELPGPSRRHVKPRRTLFTPGRVEGAPPASALTPTRVTIGRYVDSGEQFTIVDSWRSRSDAHLDLGRWWTGESCFFF